DGNGEEDQGLRISEEERLNEEEDADELYRDVDINQGRGIHLSQDMENYHVTLTPVNPDGQQESSLVSSQFVTSMLNPTSDVGMESIFVTASSSVAPLQTSTPIMTTSTIAIITTVRNKQEKDRIGTKPDKNGKPNRHDLQFAICMCARTMATTIEQQVALDEALVPSAQRLKIGRSNFRLPLDIQSKESTLQVVYDVLRRSPFFKAFLVTVDVHEIYMQEFWATTTVHQHSIRFKMDTRKHIVDLEAFREMLHISPRVPSQSFAEQPIEEEILEFLRFLRHSAQIKTLTDSQVISGANFMGAISPKKHRLCLSHLGRFCVSSGTQESKEKQ
nr:hypothetical protein [Tanacetum cinerariifolium]